MTVFHQRVESQLTGRAPAFVPEKKKKVAAEPKHGNSFLLPASRQGSSGGAQRGSAYAVNMEVCLQ